MAVVNFDLSRMSGNGIERFLSSLAEDAGQHSPFTAAICDGLSGEKERRLFGGDPVTITLPEMTREGRKTIIANLQRVKCHLQEATAAVSSDSAREDLKIASEFTSAILHALAV
jgi:hypothetical protein